MLAQRDAMNLREIGKFAVLNLREIGKNTVLNLREIGMILANVLK